MFPWLLLLFILANYMNKAYENKKKYSFLGFYFSSARRPRPRPPAQIIFSRPLTMELLFHGSPASKITFSRPLVTTVCHVFFYSFKQSSTLSLFENYFQQKVFSYINQSVAAWIDWLFFYMMQIESIERGTLYNIFVESYF